MKLDDLKQDWHKTIKTEPVSNDFGKVISAIEKETNKIDKEIKRRDFLEISIAILLIPFWIYGLTISVSSMQTIGCVVAIGASFYISYKLLAAKKGTTEKSDNIKEFLLQEKQKLSKQKRLLETVAWWYISPITLAILLITLGSNVNDAGIPQIPSNMYWYYISLVLLVVGVYGLNKRAAKKKFGPLLSNVEKRLSELDS